MKTVILLNVGCHGACSGSGGKWTVQSGTENSSRSRFNTTGPTTICCQSLRAFWTTVSNLNCHAYVNRLASYDRAIRIWTINFFRILYLFLFIKWSATQP